MIKNRQFVKEAVIKKLGGEQNLLAFFDISRQALEQWPEGKAIPEKRQLQLMIRKPDLFKVQA